MTSQATRATDTRQAEAAARQPSAGGRAADRAAEGGAGRSLVTTANKSSNGNRRLRRRAIEIARALIRATCGDLPQAKRVTRCGRVPTGQGNPKVAKGNGHAFMSGLQTCGSVWCCVACSFKVRMKRSAEISLAVKRHLDAGGGVLHVVVTMPHRSSELLDDLWAMLSDCWAYVTSGGGWVAFRQRHDVLGYIRAAEVTHSWAAGWHPHCHILLFVGKPMSPCENEDPYYELRRGIRHRWCKRMADKYGRTMSEEFGISVEPVKADDADGSGQYLTKVGYEIAMVDTKVGRGEDHRTPFAIAHDASQTGDKDDVELFREWVKASHGKRSITWSQGLRESLGLGPDRSDQDLAAENIDGETVAEIDRNLWRQICDRRDGARADFLACFESDDNRNGVAAAVNFLRGLGLVAVVIETGRDPVIRLGRPPPQPRQEQSHVEH